MLVDGFVRGSWKVERGGATTTLLIDPFVRRLTKRETSSATAEGRRLVAFLTDGAGDADVRIVSPD